jgi:hypothetical protein
MTKAEELVMRCRSKGKTDDEWLQLHEDILEFLKSNPPEEERRMFVPLGYLEMTSMVYDGIMRGRGLI